MIIALFLRKKYLNFLIFIVILFFAFESNFLQSSQNDLCKKLFQTIDSGDIESATKLVKEGIDVNCRTQSPGWTALHEAVHKKRLEFVKLLLANHADPNSQDWVGMTPLHRAAEYCGKEIALILIEKGANINALNDYSKTPLFVAAEKNNLEVAKLLIQYKASVNAIDNSNLTPLFLAASAGFDDMVNLLIQNGADPKFNEKIEKNLFESVIKRNYFSKSDSEEKKKIIVSLLLQKHLSPNTTDFFGNTPLHLAIEQGYSQIAQELINGGAYIDAVNKIKDIITQMRIDNKEVNLKPNEYGNQSPLFLATTKQNQKIVELLLKHKANPNISNNYGLTPLHNAISLANEMIAELLIKNGADVNAKDRNGWTPLHYCAFKNLVSIAKLLIEKGADLNANSTSETRIFDIFYPNGATPFEIAEKIDNSEIIKILKNSVDKGVKRNNEDIWKKIKKYQSTFNLIKEDNDVIDLFHNVTNKIKKVTYYEIPEIICIIDTDFIRKYKFLYIMEMGGPWENHDRYCLIGMKKNGTNIHRFGSFEAEFHKESFDIKNNDVKYINKVIKLENIQIGSPEVAFKVCILFSKLADFNSEPLFKSNRKMNHFPPLFKELKDGYEFQFFTDFDFWHLFISRKNKIKLINHYRY